MARSFNTGTPAQTYARLWRWHFYAGLFALPFILVLSVTGSIYLLKPQIDRWEERDFLDLGTSNAVSADEQVAAAQAISPGLRFNAYRLPRAPGDAAMVAFDLPAGDQRQVFVAPQGQVLGAWDRSELTSETVSRTHGTLLLGRMGDWLVELAASWTIVLILTGLYMWWPRPFSAAGTFWPRLGLRGRTLLKDIHRVTGYWIPGLVLVMLASGLPWAGVWGGAFAWARAEMGWVAGPQSWKTGVEGGNADHHAMHSIPKLPARTEAPHLPLSRFVDHAYAERLAFPVMVYPPHSLQRFGPPTSEDWTVKSEAQNRTLTRQVSYHSTTGVETGRQGFGDQHVLDRVVNTGLAWHEGQLFGLANQLIGLFTALALIALSLAGVLMWLKRRPQGTFSSPQGTHVTPRAWVICIAIVLGILLPLFALSVLAILLLDHAIDQFRQKSLPS